jgi:hypothetical protein
VAYHVYRGPGAEVPTIPGTLGRSEYGIEISVALTFMVFIVRLSMDKVCRQFEFFWGLKLAQRGDRLADHRPQSIPTTAGIAKPAPARELSVEHAPAINRHLTRGFRDLPAQHNCRHPA